MGASLAPHTLSEAAIRAHSPRFCILDQPPPAQSFVEMLQEAMKPGSEPWTFINYDRDEGLNMLPGMADQMTGCEKGFPLQQSSEFACIINGGNRIAKTGTLHDGARLWFDSTGANKNRDDCEIPAHPCACVDIPAGCDLEQLLADPSNVEAFGGRHTMTLVLSGNDTPHVSNMGLIGKIRMSGFFHTVFVEAVDRKDNLPRAHTDTRIETYPKAMDVHYMAGREESFAAAAASASLEGKRGVLAAWGSRYRGAHGAPVNKEEEKREEEFKVRVAPWKKKHSQPWQKHGRAAPDGTLLPAALDEGPPQGRHAGPRQEEDEHLQKGYATPQTQDAQDLDAFLERAAFVDKREIPPKEYFSTLAQYRFLLAPKGQGVQSPKFLEAVAMMTIPITKRYAAFDDLQAYGMPFVLVDSWEEVTPEKLDEWWLATNQGVSSLLEGDCWSPAAGKAPAQAPPGQAGGSKTAVGDSLTKQAVGQGQQQGAGQNWGDGQKQGDKQEQGDVPAQQQQDDGQGQQSGGQQSGDGQKDVSGQRQGDEQAQQSGAQEQQRGGQDQQSGGQEQQGGGKEPCDGMVDTEFSCQGWMALGQCASNPAYMQAHCKLACCLAQATRTNATQTGAGGKQGAGKHDGAKKRNAGAGGKGSAAPAAQGGECDERCATTWTADWERKCSWDTCNGCESCRGDAASASTEQQGKDKGEGSNSHEAGRHADQGSGGKDRGGKGPHQLQERKG